MILNDVNTESLWIIVLSLLLTYSLPKIIELFMKRYGEPKVSIDTFNIENTLKLYNTLAEKHRELEKKYSDLELKYETLKDEFEEQERKLNKLEGK